MGIIHRTQLVGVLVRGTEFAPGGAIGGLSGLDGYEVDLVGKGETGSPSAVQVSVLIL